MLLKPLKDLQKQQKESKHKVYKPRMVMLLGNHCNRIDRAVNNNPTLEGLISTKDLNYEQDWEVHQFLDVVVIDGIAYSHYFTTGVLGRPATSAAAQLAKKHMSCVAGHQQGLQIHTGHRADGVRLTSIKEYRIKTSTHIYIICTAFTFRAEQTGCESITSTTIYIDAVYPTSV